MSLLVWIPMVHGDCKDQGLLGVETSVVNTVTYVDGKLGKAAQIGNGNQVTNGISINTNLVEELGTQYSCSVWVKPLGNHVHYEGAIISSGDWNKKCWAFGVNQDNSKVDIFCGGYNRNVTCSVPINQWTHLVSVNNGTYVNLYKNGELVSTTSASSWPLDSDATNTTIGRETYANGYFSFNGCIQDLRIYDHALSPLEVKHLAQGLVLHYPLSDPYIESTTNLITTEDCLSQTCYNSATSKYGYGANTDIYKTVTTYDGRKGTKVYMGTNGNSCYPYVYVNNMYTSDGSNAPAYKTLSFDYYGTIGNYLIPYRLGSGNGTATYKVTCQGIETTGSNNNSVSVQVTPNKWNHIEITFHGTTAADSQWGYIRIGNGNHTSDTSNFWFFANMQLEAKDHATGYAGVGGTRTSATIYDTSGFYNNGTTNGQLTISTDTPKYNASSVFTSNTDSIKIKPIFSNGQTINELTVSCWFKTNTLNDTAPNIFSLGANSFCRARIASNNAVWWYTHVVSTSAGAQRSCKTLTDNTWHHMVFTFKNGIETMYIDGESIGTNDRTGTGTYLTCHDIAENDWVLAGYNSISERFLGSLSDFRIYTTPLSSDDVMALYKNAGYVDSDGNVYAYEMTE